MDAYSVSRHNSVEEKESSRLYQDLFAFQSRYCTETESFSNQPSLSAIVAQYSLKTARHIGIIGAGISGLRTADILLSAGFRVTILEGRSRIGGRVHQQVFHSGHTVDMGANWIHGTAGNPIYMIAKETRTTCSGWEATAFAAGADGGELSEGERTEAADIMWGIIQDAFAVSNSGAGKGVEDGGIPAEKSLWDYFEEEVPKRIVDSGDCEMRKRRLVMDMAEGWGAFIGSPVKQQSLRFFWLEECLEGENLFVEGTHKAIMATIAKHALDKADIRLETIVNQITYRSTTDDPSTPIIVTTLSGETFGFDDLVVTTPLGWLKKNQCAFSPMLPPRMATAIDSISYGCLEKVYISFRGAFWQEKDPQGGIKSTLAGFSQWLAPEYAERTNPKKWGQEMIELASFGELDAHPTLLFYMYGEQSKYITSTLATLSEKEQHDFLITFFMPYISRLPRYDPAYPDCEITKCLASSWLTDDLAGNGSYGNFQVGLVEGDKDIETMREGIPDGGLWFAGEHTAPFVAVGTTTGAYWSGEAVAKRITEKYAA